MSTKTAVRKPDFRLASERLELAIGSVRTVMDGGIAGKSMPLELSFALLSALAVDDLRYGRLIQSKLEELRAHSDEPIKWVHGRGLSALADPPAAVRPHRWSSAHEAATAVVEMVLYYFFWRPGEDGHDCGPLALKPTAGPGLRIPEFNTLTNEQRKTFKKMLNARLRKAFLMTDDEVGDWQERIRRERAKLLAATKSDSKGPLEWSRYLAPAQWCALLGEISNTKFQKMRKPQDGQPPELISKCHGNKKVSIRIDCVAGRLNEAELETVKQKKLPLSS